MSAAGEWAALRAACSRDLRMAIRRPSELLLALAFALLIAMLFGIALAGDPRLLAKVGPAVLYTTFLPRGAVGRDEHVDVTPRRHRRLGEEPRPFQLGGGLVQPHRRRHHLVMPRLWRSFDESVCTPAGDHIPAVGRPDRPRSGRRLHAPAAR